MNKVLVKLYVPAIEQQYEILIPLNKKIYDIIILLTKGINDLYEEEYNPTEMPNLYNKLTCQNYDINLRVCDTDIRNATELILI